MSELIRVTVSRRSLALVVVFAIVLTALFAFFVMGKEGELEYLTSKESLAIMVSLIVYRIHEKSRKSRDHRPFSLKKYFVPRFAGPMAAGMSLVYRNVSMLSGRKLDWNWSELAYGLLIAVFVLAVVFDIVLAKDFKVGEDTTASHILQSKFVVTDSNPYDIIPESVIRESDRLEVRGSE